LYAWPQQRSTSSLSPRALRGPRACSKRRRSAASSLPCSSSSSPSGASTTVNVYLDEPYVYQARMTVAPGAYYSFTLGTILVGYANSGDPDVPGNNDVGMPLALTVYSDQPVVIRIDSFGPSGQALVPPWVDPHGTSLEPSPGTYQQIFSGDCMYAADATGNNNTNCMRAWGVNLVFLPMQWNTTESGAPSPPPRILPKLGNKVAASNRSPEKVTAPVAAFFSFAPPKQVLPSTP